MKIFLIKAQTFASFVQMSQIIHKIGDVRMRSHIFPQENEEVLFSDLLILCPLAKQNEREKKKI